jgi:V/A-type H+-transporting ATPase subunit E
MALNEIVTKISGDAKTQAEKLIDQAQSEAQRYIDKAKAEIESRCKQILTDGEQQATRRKNQRLQIATLDNRKRILAEKQALIATVFERALKELEHLDKSKYTSMLKKMLANYPLEGDEELIVSAADRERLGKEFITELNKSLKIQGKQGNCRWSTEQRPIKGGFIVRRQKIEGNCSFESLLKSQQEELEQEVARILFD